MTVFSQLIVSTSQLSLIFAAPGGPRWGDNPAIQQKFWPAVNETLLMV